MTAPPDHQLGDRCAGGVTTSLFSLPYIAGPSAQWKGWGWQKAWGAWSGYEMVSEGDGREDRPRLTREKPAEEGNEGLRAGGKEVRRSMWFVGKGRVTGRPESHAGPPTAASPPRLHPRLQAAHIVPTPPCS